MPERAVEIGRLVLRGPGVDVVSGEELGRRVAAGLAAAGTPSDDIVPRISVSVAAGADDDVDMLSERIVQTLTQKLGFGR